MFHINQSCNRPKTLFLVEVSFFGQRNKPPPSVHQELGWGHGCGVPACVPNIRKINAFRRRKAEYKHAGLRPQQGIICVFTHDRSLSGAANVSDGVFWPCSDKGQTQESASSGKRKTQLNTHRFADIDLYTSSLNFAVRSNGVWRDGACR